MVETDFGKEAYRVAVGKKFAMRIEL